MFTLHYLKIHARSNSNSTHLRIPVSFHFWFLFKPNLSHGMPFLFYLHLSESYPPSKLISNATSSWKPPCVSPVRSAYLSLCSLGSLSSLIILVIYDLLSQHFECVPHYPQQDSLGSGVICSWSIFVELRYQAR